MKKLCLLLACVVFVGVNFLQAQTVQITGTITSSEDGQPIPGVSIQVKGTTIGVVTDLQGNYSINVPQTATTLVVSFLGFRTQEIEIQGRQVINLQLEFDVLDLEEIVVVGYGVQRKREVTGSISQVKGNDLASLAMPSFDQQLAGRAAGVQVTQQTGIIGEAPRIRIRGISSISSGTYPLIVVDGQPIITGDQGGYASTNALADINPSDIESIEILKDGSATAIYGSRAANGVLIITTKKGTAGKMQLNYGSTVGTYQPVKLFDLTSENEWLGLMDEMYSNAGLTSPAVAAGLNTDWQSAVMRNGFQHDHNLSISGGTQLTSYYFSLGYGSQEGIAIANSMERFTFRANLDQKVNNWLKIGANSNLARTSYSGLNTGENSLSGNVFSAIRQLPNTPVYDDSHPTGYNIEGNLVGRWNNTATIDDNLTNIRYVLDQNKNNSIVNRATIGTYGTVTLLPSLIFQTNLGVDITMTEGLMYWNPIHGDGQSVNGRIYNTQTNRNRWNIANTLNYIETFGDVHNITATLVQEAGKLRYNYFFAGGTGMSDTYFNQGLIGGTYGTQLSSGSIFENGILSYAGRLNYNYDSKYFFQASVRYDGLSSLPEANKWGLFPAVSVGWTLSRESFMEDIEWLSDLKLRASYAEVGNSSIGNYPYLGLYSGFKYADYNGIAFDQMGNDQLKWETSKKSNIGVDVSILEGKYSLTYDYFVDNNDGLILAKPTPPTMGVPGNSYYENIGKVKNWGHEFGARANIYRTKDFSWSVDANISFVKNEVLELVDGQDITFDYTIIRVGESIRSVYGYDYVGVNKANGFPIYRKADGTMVQGNYAGSNYRVYDPSNPSDISQASSLDADDKIIFGSSMPTYFGAISSSLTYKGFDFSAMFRFSGGNYIMNRTRADLVSNSFTNAGSELLGRWQSPENPGDGWTPKLYYGLTNFINKQGETSGRFVEKGDFFKLQNLVLGYTLPPSLVNKIGVQRLRVFVSATEIFTLTNYTGIDPEMERISGVDWNGTPRARSLVFGVNLSL